MLLDSTPVECGRSVETVRRSELADFCGYGYCKSHSRFSWGMRLHLCAASDGTPRAAALVAADRAEREVARSLLPHVLRGGEALVTDKGYAGREFELAVAGMDAKLLRPARRDEPDNGLQLSSIRQRIESIFWSCKDLLTLERTGRARSTASPCASVRACSRSSVRCAQPPARPSEPLARGLCGLSGWNQPSRPGATRRGAGRHGAWASEAEAPAAQQT